MNEKGVTLAGATIETQKVTVDSSKSKITGGYLFRKILDHAKNIKDAISIIKEYNLVNPDGTLSGHTLIGDSSGKSIIVECYQGNIEIMPNKESWQIATNTPIYTYYMNNSINEVPCYI